MSSLEKLAIRGIRSFDDKEMAVMQFYTPLTVIVGHNGSGKTTIIECLKYVTTGDLPPNTKGGAFVHDPAIANEREVKAEVRLRFRNVNKDRMVVTRKLQVTATKSKLSMKTLEGTLSFADDQGDSSKRRTISTRAAELDEELPTQLGVSRAILDNVIFCHQEDSNWPLSEPAALKKKFDDIFEATKYTKALDQIKAIKKEMSADIKVDKERLIAFKVDRERAKKLEVSIDKISIEINSKETEAEELDGQVQTAYRENQEFYQQATQHAKILNDAKTKTSQVQIFRDSIQSMLETMNILKDSDDELKKKQANFEKHVQQQADKLKARNEELINEQDQLSRLRSRQQAQFTLEGKLVGEAETYRNNLEERQKLVVQLAGTHGIAGYDVLPLEDDQIDSFRRRLEAEVDKRAEDIRDLKKQRNKEETAKGDEIQQFKSKEAGAHERRRGVTSQLNTVRAEITSLTNKIDAAAVSEGDIETQEFDLGENEKRLKASKEKQAAANFDQQNKDLQVEIRNAEAERDSLLKEIATFNTHMESRARLGMKKDEKRTKEAALQSSLTRSEAKYSKYVGNGLSASSMEHEVTMATKTKEDELAGAEQQGVAISRDYQALETRTSFAKKRLKQLQTELTSHKAKIAAALEEHEADTVEEGMRTAEEEASIRSKELETIDYAAKFHERILKEAKSKHACVACKRGITDAEMPELENYCKNVIKGAPARKKELQEEFQQWTEEVEKLRAALPSELALKKLQDVDIPAIQKDHDEALAKYGKISDSQEEAKRKIEALKADIREMQVLKRTATDTTRFVAEIKAIDKDIERAENELAVTGSVQTIEDVQKKLEGVSSSINKRNESLRSLAREKDTQRNTIQMLESAISKGNMDLMRARHALKQRQDWEQSKEAARAQIQELENALKAIDAEAKNAAAPIRKLEESLHELRADFDRKERELQKKQEQYDKSLRHLEAARSAIDRYEMSGAGEKLDRTRATLADLNKQMAEIEQAAKSISAAIRQAEKEASETEQVKRNMVDNIKYREQQQKIKTLQDEIEDMNIESAEKAYRKFDTEYEAARQRQAKMQAKQNSLMGEIVSLKKSYADKKQELASEYKDVKSEYRAQLIKVKINEFAIQDLDKYGKALDTAIMKYHEHKMKEINDTIQGLWTKTYQGTDIDKIMIKSDHEGVKAGGRSYNYRVVMLKDQVEMDMRGRCSAGQKVLASIIIRLALAESFGTNCGILALDEPTTNLDKDNIQSLAASLADIIRERRSQANFQLIVITHDEDLLAELSKADVLDRFWRVSRNTRQKSTIERQWVDEFQH